MKRSKHMILPIAGMIALSLIPAQAKDKKSDPDEIGNSDVGKGVNLYSLEKEIALGKQLAQELEREVKFVDAPVPAEFVNRLAQNLARNSDSKVPVTAKVIDSDEVNAFALPGGFLYVNSGLILKAETEAELSAAMAHEIAHVAARHGTRQASRARIMDIASLPLIFLGGWAGYGIRQGAGIAIPLGFLKFSCAFEQEADLLGLQYMYKAGYDPTAFIDFFEKLEAAEKEKAWHRFEDLRLPSERSHTHQIHAAECTGVAKATTTIRGHHFRVQRCARLPAAGAEPAQDDPGKVRANSSPASRRHYRSDRRS